MDKVVHFEVPADNVERAQKFFGDVFGWEIHKAPLDTSDYYFVHTVETDDKGMPKESGAINGGMMKRQSPSESVVIVLSVASLQRSLDKVEEAGGKVVTPEMKVGDMGLYARVTDTEGNVIGLWQNLK